MNSKSKCYYNDCDSKSAYEPSGYDSKCRKSGYNTKCKEEDTDSCPVIIKCSTGGSTIIPATAVTGDTFTVATLNLNTSCLEDPCSIIDFLASLDPGDGFSGAVSFQLFKTSLCVPGATPVSIGSSFPFSVGATGATAITTFTFSACDCDNCICNCNCNCNCNISCYSYTVVATVTATTGATLAGTLTVNTPIIKSISTCSTSGC